MSVNDQELTERILYQAQQYQMPPEEFVRRIQEAGQLGAIYSDVRRSKALDAAASAAATVTDESGAPADRPTWSAASAMRRTRLSRTSLGPTTPRPTPRVFEADPDAVETAEEPVDSPATDAPATDEPGATEVEAPAHDSVEPAVQPEGGRAAAPTT